MFPFRFRPHLGDVRDRFIIAPHHPDRLRRPPHAVTAADERSRQALIWNVFRTLELVTPSFWLRRLHARLTGEAALVSPQIVEVRLWESLPLPPIQRIDGGQADVFVDVVIETEHTLWALTSSCDVDPSSVTDRAGAIVDAASWRAGARQYYCGVIESRSAAPSFADVVKARFARSAASAALQSNTRGPATPRSAVWGAVQWPDLAALLRDCRSARNVPAIEQALAGNALDWLAAVGIRPNETQDHREVAR
jgi:hypothetical protein